MTVGDLVSSIFTISYVISIIIFWKYHGNPFTFKDNRTHMQLPYEISILIKVVSLFYIIIIVCTLSVLLGDNWDTQLNIFSNITN